MKPTTNIRLLVGLKTKTVAPSLYTVLMEANDRRFLHTCIEYSLEGAEADAVRALKGQGVDEEDWKLSMFDSQSVDGLATMLESLTVSPKEQGDKSAVKNLVMREIVESGDKALYAKYKKILNKFERKYIEEALSRKKSA